MRFSFATFLFFAVLQFLPLRSVAQKEELEKFLIACQSPDEPEFKKVIRDYSFNYRPDAPILDYGSIDGSTTDTDMPNLKVFKGSVICKTETDKKVMGEKLTTDQKMVVIMYFDKIRNSWAVYDLRGFLEPDKEYATSKARADKGDFYSSKEVVYRNLAYWALMAGKVAEAKKYSQLSTDAAIASKNDSFLVGTERVFKAIL